MKKYLLVILLFSLSGCGYTGDYDKYADALTAHSNAEQGRISAQAKAISTTLLRTKTQSQSEATLLSVIAMMQIERLHFVPLRITAPTTGMDVLHSAVGYVPFVTMGLTTYKIAERGLESAGNIALNADTVSVNDAFNRFESHATGQGNSSTVATAPPTVVDPVVITGEKE